MDDARTAFERTPIQAMDCMSESWQLLKDQYWLFLAITLVGMIIQSLVPFSILTGPMMCGIFVAWFALMRGEVITFDMLFKGFDYFVESLIATLILVGITMVVMIPCYGLMFVGIALGAAAGQDSPEVAGFVTLLTMCVFLLVILTVITVIMTLALFLYPLIVDRKLKAVPALKTSAKAAWANIGGVLALFGVISVVGLIASILCIVPVFLVTPWCIGAVGIAYRRVFPATGDVPASV